jgi:hypothetical protein
MPKPLDVVALLSSAAMMSRKAETYHPEKGQATFMLSFVEELRVPSDEWIKTLADGRRVKFTYQELLDERAFITAQVEGNKVVYSIVLTNAKTPLSREEVESHFEGELLKK